MGTAGFNSLLKGNMIPQYNISPAYVLELLFGGDTEQILTALIHRAEKQLKLEKKRMIEESTQNRSQLFLRGRSRNEFRSGQAYNI